MEQAAFGENVACFCKAEAEKAGDDRMRQMDYATLMGCVERALQK